MTKAEAQNNNALPHDLILEGRGKLTVTGVRRMLRCDPGRVDVLEYTAQRTAGGFLHRLFH